MTRTYPYFCHASGWSQIDIGTPGAPRIVAIEAPLDEALAIAAGMTGPDPLASWRTTVEAEAAAAKEPDCVGGVDAFEQPVRLMSQWTPGIGDAVGPGRMG